MPMLRTLRARLHAEDGWALLTAIMLMTIMMGASLSVVSAMDNQSNQGRIGRNRETAFNIGEGALNGQVFALAQNWPGQSTQGFTTCNQATGGTKCPNTALSGRFPTSDAAGSTWITSVRDNTVAGAPNFYSDSATASAPGYDSNGDGLLWVRAQATARGKTRTMVALVRAETQVEDAFRAAVLSGRVDLQNNGNKTTVDDTGSVTVVRCVASPSEPAPCMGYSYGDSPDKLAVQIAPSPITSNPSIGNAMTPEALDRLKATAITQGNYYTSCPASLEGNVDGEVFYIDTTANCSYNGGTFNSALAPGMVIMNNGSISFGGNVTYYGIVYHRNAQATSGTVVDLGGTSCIQGAILVDGAATTHIGSSGHGCEPDGNVKYDANAFKAIKTIGKAGIVQNTWRELASR
jgi:hypothetical protein